MTERLRKFFRIRGKTAFALDEIVAPVVLVQDLTVGPYQSGVTPSAGQINMALSTVQPTAFALIINDKSGSVTPILDAQFDERSFSVTYIELQFIGGGTPTAPDDLLLSIAPRANVFAGTPTNSGFLTSIQNNDGTLSVPVEMYIFDTGLTGGRIIWRGILGDNANVLGSMRSIDPQPNITIGPTDAIILQNSGTAAGAGDAIRVHIRGFYQQQPA